MQLQTFLNKPWAKPLFIFLLAAVFYSWNLAGQYYQLDEAGTILQAEGIANLGYPSGWDGRTLISDNNGREYNLAQGSFFYTWQPPAQSYLAFWGGEFLGKTVFGYRFLFALFGAGTVAVFYYLASLLFKKRWIAYLLTAQLLFLLPFFVYIRQVRYYAPSAFGNMILVYLLYKLWKREWGRKELIIMFLTSTGLFLTNYFVWAGSVVFLGFVLLWKHEKLGILTLALTGILPVVWYLTVHPFAGDPAGAYHRSMNVFWQFSRYLPLIHNYFFPLFLVPLFFIGKRPGTLLLLLGVFIVFKLAVYSVLLDSHGRYLVDLMPIFVLLYGFLYQSLDTTKTKVLIPVIALIFLTIVNSGSFMPKAWIESGVSAITTPYAYSRELLYKYPSLMVPLSSYLQQDYQEGDIFWSNNYRDIVTVTSGIPHFTPVCNLATNTPLGPQSVSDRDHIRWFIFFQYDPRFPQKLDSIDCLGKEWQRKLETEYTRSEFILPPGFYTINDPDIVGRKIPPLEARPNQVIIYERKPVYAIKKLETFTTVKISSYIYSLAN